MAMVKVMGTSITAAAMPLSSSGRTTATGPSTKVPQSVTRMGASPPPRPIRRPA